MPTKRCRLSISVQCPQRGTAEGRQADNPNLKILLAFLQRNRITGLSNSPIRCHITMDLVACRHMEMGLETTPILLEEGRFHGCVQPIPREAHHLC